MWPCLEIVDSGHASWTEVTEKMSIDDVQDVRDTASFTARLRAGKAR